MKLKLDWSGFLLRLRRGLVVWLVVTLLMTVLTSRLILARVLTIFSHKYASSHGVWVDRLPEDFVRRLRDIERMPPNRPRNDDFRLSNEDTDR